MFTAAQVRTRVLVLNNALEKFDLPSQGWDLVDGSNRLGEFSGWQEGLSFVKKNDDARDGVVFANDTICTHRHFTRFRKAAFTKALNLAAGPALIGFRDTAPPESSIAGMSVPSWVSTYCFALTRPAIDSLNWSLYDERSVVDCVPGGIDEAHFFSEMSENLSVHLRQWLFERGWYGAAALSSANYKKFEHKAKCIVAELILSARCIRLGISSVDPFAAYKTTARLDKAQRKLAGLLNNTG
jgi:hypothetical protein